MRQTESAEQFRAMVALRIGGDPVAAVEYGIRRGWVQRPAPDPAARNGNSQPEVDPDHVAGYEAAARVLGMSASWVWTLVKRHRLTPAWVDGHPVFSRAALEAFEPLAQH